VRLLEPDVWNLGAVAGVPAKRHTAEPSGVVDQEEHSSSASGRLTKSSSVAVASATVAFRESRARRKRAYEEPCEVTNRCSHSEGAVASQPHFDLAIRP
jgi:hypothetical protein